MLGKVHEVAESVCGMLSRALTVTYRCDGRHAEAGVLTSMRADHCRDGDTCVSPGVRFRKPQNYVGSGVGIVNRETS